jgi:hypothetical protein
MRFPRSSRGSLVMRRYEIGRIDCVEFARFGKVSLEVGGIDLDVGQIPAMPAPVINDFHSIGLFKAR